jgi:hypothetical protein
MEATMKSFMFTLTILVSLLLASCGSYQGPASSPATYTIGGTVSGLTGSGLVLQNNSGNNLSVTTNGSFTFTTAIASGNTFNVTAFSQPSNPAQTCGVAAGASGTVASANVTSVVVTCTTNTYTIGGTVSGLSGAGLVLQNNGGNNLSVGAGATSFTFTTAIASGSTFNVTVFSQPSHSCVVTAGANGTVASANVTSVVVTCIDGVLTGSMNNARSGHTATLLNNGQVLVTGGSPDNDEDVLASAELYDPATGTFAFTGSMNNARDEHAATLLNNGNVLVTGGNDGADDLASTELYDPATGTFTVTGSMNDNRLSHTATLLNNGKVLITGGDRQPSTVLASAELYDPATGTFTVTGSMNNARYFHSATLLNNGQVLVTGGIGDLLPGNELASAELYDPATGTFTATGSMINTNPFPTATLLNNGAVLVRGRDAELYNPATGTFTAAGSMNNLPFGSTTLLNNGNVLVTGENSAELYDPAAGTFFTTTGSLGSGTLTLLNNGNVLIADSAELYLPDTLTPTGLVSITVTPTTPTVSVGSTQQFIATGTFSDGSMEILQSVMWSSSNQAAVTITNDVGDHGVALALAAGQSTITASAGSISGSTVLTVQ